MCICGGAHIEFKVHVQLALWNMQGNLEEHYKHWGTLETDGELGRENLVRTLFQYKCLVVFVYLC